MCDFVSWIEYQDNIYFLNNECLRTKEGKALKRYLGDQFKEDVKGHGAIRRYFDLPENKGTNRECTNFSKPSSFPPVIVEAIKNGSLSTICDNVPLAILTKSAWAEYDKIEQPAWAEYNKIEQPARAEYDKIRQPAWAEYNKIRQSAWAEYNKIEQPARAEYDKIEQPAWAEYNKIEQSAWAEYNKIRQSAWAEYDKIEQSAFWKLATNPRNRAKEWR